MTTIEVEPQPRIDTLVQLPGGGQARRTEYVGTVWFGNKPELSGMYPKAATYAQNGVRMANVKRSFFVPDSLPYNRAMLANSTLSVSVFLQASGETSAVVDAAATFTDDPSGVPTWIQAHFQCDLSWPAGVGYRIVALTPPDAVR